MPSDHPAWLNQRRPSWPPHNQFPPEHHRRESRMTESKAVAAAVTLGLGALAGLAAYSFLGPSKPQMKRQSDVPRLPDDAPGRTAKQARFGDYSVTGRAVTINRPRQEIYAFWRDFRNLSRFMENIEKVKEEPDGLTVWTIRAPLGMTMEVRSRIVNEREGEQIAWRSTSDSDIETEGKVTFRDAPAGRGTIVEAHVAYKPPMGALGQAVAKIFSAEPSIQSRRDLKRLKMLLETGEIATNANQAGHGGKYQKAVEPNLRTIDAV